MPHIKIIHLLTFPNDDREKKSIEQFSKLGLEYEQIINKIYKGKPPPTKYGKGNKGQFGCYTSHTNCLREHINDDVDALLIIECDAKLLIPPDEFVIKLNEYYEQMVKYNIICLAIGAFVEKDGKEQGQFYVCPAIWMTQSVLHLTSAKKEILNKINTLDWWLFDSWLGLAFGDGKLAVTKKRTTSQFPGRSLVTFLPNVCYSDRTNPLDIYGFVATYSPKQKLIGKPKI